ncbi:hypothetical protein [Elizabethkingia sp. 2-6]|nr:hypothetical protein [Elizabethkingia sp. 2-6]QCO45830.1 hypothetical protein FCS00_05380 [Elizabethkingia sp. 2-6]
MIEAKTIQKYKTKRLWRSIMNNIKKMSNKTALHEILSKLKEHEHLFGNMYPQFESWLKEGIEKEKQQIMDAFENGKYGFGTSMEIYYEAIYGNPQGDQETTK